MRNEKWDIYHFSQSTIFHCLPSLLSQSTISSCHLTLSHLKDSHLTIDHKFKIHPPSPHQPSDQHDMVVDCETNYDMVELFCDLICLTKYHVIIWSNLTGHICFPLSDGLSLPQTNQINQPKYDEMRNEMVDGRNVIWGVIWESIQSISRSTSIFPIKCSPHPTQPPAIRDDKMRW